MPGSARSSLVEVSFRDGKALGTERYVQIQFLPHREQRASLTKTNLIMLFIYIIVVYSENHTKPLSALFEA
jgi:hypothetical protein